MATPSAVPHIFAVCLIFSRDVNIYVVYHVSFILFFCWGVSVENSDV